MPFNYEYTNKILFSISGWKGEENYEFVYDLKRSNRYFKLQYDFIEMEVVPNSVA